MLLRGGGAGLGGLLIIGGVLYYTGAGGWMIDRMQSLEGACYEGLRLAGPSVTNPVCHTMGKGVEIATKGAQSAGDAIRKVEGIFTGSKSVSTPHFESLNALGDSLQRQLSSLSSSAQDLERMVQAGPQQLTGGSAGQQFQRAVDSFTIGNSYAKSGNVTQAVPWLQQGARQPQGFGLMSQLSLANLYRTGGNGIPANPAQSQAYYGLASNSLSQLSQSNTPQARQVLQSLPVSPQQAQQEIQRAIQTMKTGR